MDEKNINKISFLINQIYNIKIKNEIHDKQKKEEEKMNLKNRLQGQH